MPNDAENLVKKIRAAMDYAVPEERRAEAEDLLDLYRDDRLVIRVNVVIGYGNRITTIAENVITNVKYIVEQYTGLIVDKVEVHVQGVRIVD